jgi:hypothetical protein
LIAIPSARETEIAGIREKAAFRTKIPTKGKWPILKCISLSTKIFFASKTFLQVLLLTIQLLKITKEGLQEIEDLGEEAKVSSFLWLSAFPLEHVPLQLLQDHRDGDAETLGAGMLCSFHQTVSGGLQVVVPVGHIRRRRRKDSHQTRDLNLNMRFNGG